MINWSEQQAAVFNWVERGTGSAVIEAVAGSGKTTTLVAAVRKMRGSVFLGAYNKKMGDELKKRVADLKSVRAGTFHSAGFGALLYAVGKDIQVDEKKVAKIAATVTDKTAFEGWEPAICAAVSMAKQSGFYCRNLVLKPTSADWNTMIARHDIMDKLPEDATPADLIRLADATLRRSAQDRKVVDFDDMIYMPLFLNCRLFQNDWVLVDEAQDTNATRRELARRMLKPAGRLVAVGDPHQAIFGFTGADGDSLEIIKREFKARTMQLDVTYRCPKLVVAAAHEYVSHIQSAPSSEQGEHLDVTYDEMVKLCVPGDAILSRYNKYLVTLCFKLIREGKPAKIEGRSIGEGLAALAGRWKVKTIDLLETRLATYTKRETDKATAADDQAKLDRLLDQMETMRVLIERAREQGMTTVAALQEMVRSMFDDVGADKKLVVLSSVHKSKGLEWHRVFILGRRELMPSPRAEQEWQKQQELNLCYVAVTRSQYTLVDVELGKYL